MDNTGNALMIIAGVILIAGYSHPFWGSCLILFGLVNWIIFMQPKGSKELDSLLLEKAQLEIADLKAKDFWRKKAKEGKE